MTGSDYMIDDAQCWHDRQLVALYIIMFNVYTQTSGWVTYCMWVSYSMWHLWQVLEKGESNMFWICPGYVLDLQPIKWQYGLLLLIITFDLIFETTASHPQCDIRGRWTTAPFWSSVFSNVFGQNIWTNLASWCVPLKIQSNSLYGSALAQTRLLHDTPRSIRRSAVAKAPLNNARGRANLPGFFF